MSLDVSTEGILVDLATIGIFGKNKAQVAANLISQWIWNNEEKLARYGIKLPSKRKPRRKNRP